MEQSHHYSELIDCCDVASKKSPAIEPGKNSGSGR